MRLDFECLFCTIRQMLKASRKSLSNRYDLERVMRMVLRQLAKSDWNESPMVVAHRLFNMVKELSNNPDPYKEEKKDQNKKALALYPMLREILEKSKNKLLTAVKLAIAGNLIDFGPGHQFEVSDVIMEALNKSLAIDHFKDFTELLKTANKIVYIGDNAGEIVFDRILLEQLKSKEITFFVRSEPVVNDIIYDDAIETGIDKIAKIEKLKILPESRNEGISLDEMKNLFQKTDLVIAKGQANYELFDNYPGKIFFLLRVKCEPIARALNSRVGDVILAFNKRL